MRSLIKLVRPKQWVKNSLVFAALIFSQHYLDPIAWVHAAITFAGFCAIASAIYIINDIHDLEYDRKHPVKSKRPLASGEVKVARGVTSAIFLFLVAVTLGWLVNVEVLGILIGYAVVMVLYSYVLKQILLLDIFIIAIGLTSRAVIGAEAIEVDISRWLIVCTFFIALTLAMVKRRQELNRIGEDLSKGRKSLRYSPPLPLWDLWIGTMSGITILAYTLYTLDPLTTHKVGSTHLIYTVPFVAYALLRYQILVYSANLGEDPTETLLSDRGILITMAGWLLVVLIVLYT